MNYARFVEQDRRLCLLRTLHDAPGYRTNSSVLETALDEYALACSRDVIHTELTFLAEQGLVTVEDVKTVKVATLTSRGADVATGRVKVDGIKRPGPKGS